jgi:hypothetical protein
MVTRYLTRPALPKEINQVLRPLLERIRDRYDRNSPEGQCLHRVSELRLEAAPDIDASCPALTLLVLIEESDLPCLTGGVELSQEKVDSLKTLGVQAAASAVLDAVDPVAKREAWTALAELWAEPSVEEASRTDAVGSLGIEVMNGEELSYARSRETPILDLRYLSTREA